MAYLFDTDAISELFKPRPAPLFLKWLEDVPASDQYISAISLAELYSGAYKSSAAKRHLDNIENRLLRVAQVLPFDIPSAKIFGFTRSYLEQKGQRLADADLQIAATAMAHGLTIVTGNLRHFKRIADLSIDEILAQARAARKT